MNRFQSMPRGAPAWVQFNRDLARENAKWAVALRAVPEADWPASARGTKRAPLIGAWRSRDFLVQAFQERRDIVRLSINRTEVGLDLKWKDGVTWDEIQRLKREAGFGDRCAVEIYPADADIVNDTNTRHIWLLPKLPAYAWRGARKDGA